MQGVEVAIVGAGPAGISAAMRAAATGTSHLLLEESAAPANTIQRYQRGKHVMAEPSQLPLRSEVSFAAGTREQVLEAWEKQLQDADIQVRYDSAVKSIRGQRGAFELHLDDGSVIPAAHVVLAIGTQGTPRKLGVSGEMPPYVQYTLDDPDDYRDEAIVVVGAGDAAIENALALASHNKVYLVNRGDEFARAKEANLQAITRAIERRQVRCFFRSNAARIETTPDTPHPICFVVDTAEGEARVAAHRVIARIGAIPQRRFVEGCGVKYPSELPTALPELSARYESSVSGLYVIGALGGYPLIKQALNQGYEVIEYIRGNLIGPADEPLLQQKFRSIPRYGDVDATLKALQQRISLFSGLNPLLFREIMLESEVLNPAGGEEIFHVNDYTDTFYSIVDGHVQVLLGDEQQTQVPLGAGQFFGEMSLISGRRRSATVVAGEGCVLIETPRRTIRKLLASNERARATVDNAFILRAIQSSFAPNVPAAQLAGVVEAAQLNEFAAGDLLFREGDEAHELHLIRSGSVSVSRTIGGREIVTAYVAAGNYVGEMGLIGRTRRMASVRATVKTQTISLDADAFNRLLEATPQLRESMQERIRQRIVENTRMEAQPHSGDIISFLMQQGLGEATDVLLIDSTLCVGCDNCEKACAATHGGTSRLNREAGPTYATVHVPTSCRHCEDPHCMTDCPPDAIHRNANGEVYIDDSCIGCEKCMHNCPYGVIHMAAQQEQRPHFWQWLLFGQGRAPGEENPSSEAGKLKQAVKCDMCKDIEGGPACVRACPTGAALRVAPEQFADVVRGSRRL